MSVYSSRRPNRPAAALSARNPSGITSRPIPSPGITAILNDAVMETPADWSAQRGADVALREHIVQGASQPRKQQIHLVGTVAKGRCKPENVVGESAEDETITIRDPRDAFAQAQGGVESPSGPLVGHELQGAQKPTLTGIPDER